MRVRVVPHLHQQLVFFAFFILVILVGGKMVSPVVLICIPLWCWVPLHKLISHLEYPLLWIVCSGHCPFFYWVFCVSYWFVGFFSYKYLLLLCGLPFYSFNGVLWWTETLNLNLAQFSPLYLVLLMSCLTNLNLFQGHEDVLLYFLLKAVWFYFSHLDLYTGYLELMFICAVRG